MLRSKAGCLIRPGDVIDHVPVHILGVLLVIRVDQSGEEDIDQVEGRDPARHSPQAVPRFSRIDKKIIGAKLNQVIWFD